MEFTEETIKDLKPSEIVSLVKNNTEEAIKTATHKGFKDALGNIDTVVSKLGFEKKEGEKTSDFTKRVLAGSLEMNKTIETERDKYKVIAESKDESEVLAQIRQDLANQSETNKLLQKKHDEYVSNTTLAEENRKKQEAVKIIESKIFNDLNTGDYGKISEGMKKSYLSDNVNSIMQSYDVKESSSGSIEFYKKGTDELIRDGKENNPISTINLALRNEDFKNTYSAQKQKNPNLNLGNNGNAGELTFKDTGEVVEYVNTLKLPEAEKYAKITELNKKIK